MAAIEDEDTPSSPEPVSIPGPVAESPRVSESDSLGLKLTARQFIRAKGHRWERSAGFLHHQAQTLGREARLTIAEWQPLWEAYGRMAVR